MKDIEKINTLKLVLFKTINTLFGLFVCILICITVIL